MPASDQRQRRDRRTGLIIRATSVLVLLLITAMVLQLLATALPLLGQKTLVSQASPDESADTVNLRELRPDWVPRQVSNARWYESGQRRIWLARNDSGDIEGERQSATDDGDSWQAQPLSFQPRQLAADMIDISAGGNWLVLFDRAGQFALTSLLASQGDATVFITGALPGHSRVEPMPGHRSWLLIDRDRITQIHLVTRDGKPALEVLRELTIANGIKLAVPGPSSQLLAIATRDGQLEIWNTTDATRLATMSLEHRAVTVGWSSSTTLFVTDESGHRHYWRLKGLETARSFDRLFDDVHYEGYRSPAHVWQPGSSELGYEEKLSLTPLLIGTLKAALVALVLALPLAVGSAIFVGFFMSANLRNRVKPTIELIAAFPTVVIGAVTALWLAPHFMSVLIELVLATMIIPVAVVLLAFLWRRHPVSRQTGRYLPKVPFILIPVVLIFGGIGLLLGQTVEDLLFSGSLTTWVDREYGIITQQRNALIVGVALGFAIIPTIFSVAEDAIHAVPKSAASGSLALGATQWQSFRDVVLPVAMPGVLSAVMLGFGRAMGETMILLLVAGNAPLDSWSLMESLRSFSATLAIELTESPVGSTHYRVLFLAALLLFLLTFTFNTVAQLLKRHLRRQYGLNL